MIRIALFDEKMMTFVGLNLLVITATSLSNAVAAAVGTTVYCTKYYSGDYRAVTNSRADHKMIDLLVKKHNQRTFSVESTGGDK